LVLEYCWAGDITPLIGKIEEDDAKHLIVQIAEGLAYLHEQKIIHKDIKPENIQMNNRAKISELGISKLMGTSNESTIVGTPFYLAPEGFKEEKID
jgi:serine/threonine protein kinase